MTSIDEIENNVKPFLLTDISFFLDGKKLKSGKLILFTIRDFFCVFTLHDSNKNKKIVYEVPYLFSLHTVNKTLEFDYTIDTFCEKCIDIQSSVKALSFKKTSKFFNKRLVIQSQHNTIRCE